MDRQMIASRLGDGFIIDVREMGDEIHIYG